MEISEEEFSEILDFVEKKYKTFYPEVERIINESIKEALGKK